MTCDIVQRFRLHRIVMSADVAKMYWQVWVHPENRCLQKILWRKTPDQPITTYELNILTMERPQPLSSLLDVYNN